MNAELDRQAAAPILTMAGSAAPFPGAGGVATLIQTGYDNAANNAKARMVNAAAKAQEERKRLTELLAAMIEDCKPEPAPNYATPAEPGDPPRRPAVITGQPAPETNPLYNPWLYHRRGNR